MTDDIDRTDVTEPDMIVTDLSADEARALTDQIKADAEALWDKIATAYIRRAWTALDYPTWDQYCITEFGTSRLRVPREERAEIVTSLRHAGLSIRAIASATGTSVNTVQADLQVSQTDTPEELVDEDALTEAALAAGEQDTRDVGARGPGNRWWSGKPIIGTDGKTYRPQRKPTPTPEPTPAQRRSDDNEIKFGIVVRSILRDLDALMAFAKALDADAKRRVLDKNQVVLMDCVAKLVVINAELLEPERAAKLLAISRELSEPEQEPAAES